MLRTETVDPERVRSMFANYGKADLLLVIRVLLELLSR